MNFSTAELMRSMLLFSVALILAACGGGATGGPTGATAAGQLTFVVGGTVTGLSGKVVLQDNLGDNLSITVNGPFTFATKVADGSPYNVTVLTQPTGQNCTVSPGVGTIASSNVGNVAVVCSKDAYNIGGTVSGLTGTVVLQDNNGDNLTVSANGPFTFANKVAYGSPYSVSVLTQPGGQTCSVSSGAGSVSTSDVASVAVVCSMNAYTVGGSVTGLAMGASVVLKDNNSDNLAVVSNGSFAFNQQVAYGSPYAVTIFTRPSGQACSVVNGSGTMGAANVSDVAITCFSSTQMGGAMQRGALSLVPTVSTLAVSAAFGNPSGITTDGTNLYVADNWNNIIRKVVIATGAVTTLAGTGVAGAADGPGATATFYYPIGITTDGTNLYVTDLANKKIRKIVIATGVVSSLTGVASTPGPTPSTCTATPSACSVDGAGTAATFNAPSGITTDGTNLYVADFSNNKIRKIVIATGFVSSVTGVASTPGPTSSTCFATPSACAVDGAGASAIFNGPTGITTDGINLYVTDYYNNKIRMIVIATSVVSSLTGVTNTAVASGAMDGAGAVASFFYPQGITSDGDNLYVSENQNQKIRKIVIATGVVSSLTGVANTAAVSGAADGAGAAATFNFPGGITSDGTSLYVMDTVNNKIRKIQ